MTTRRPARVGAALTLAAAIAAPAQATAPAPRTLAPVASAAKPAVAGSPTPRLAQAAKPATPPASPRAPVAARPPADEAAVDAELLEFLGSVGGETDDGGDWLDFLASTDVEKVAKGGARAPARGK